MFDIEQYYEAGSVEEAVRLLSEHEDAEIIKRSLLPRDADGAAVGSFIFPLIYSFL